MAARMGSSQSSPSILLTLSPHFGFSRRTDPLDSLNSAPLVLCACASLRDHVPPTATKKARRRAANILLGIPAAPPVRSPHSLSALVNAMSGSNMKRWRNATRNSWNRVLEPVRNSNDSATFFSSIKSLKFSDRNPSCEKTDTTAFTSSSGSSATAEVRKKPTA